MWVHPINIKRPEFGILSHLYPDLVEDEEKFPVFLEWTSSNCNFCHNWWDRNSENKIPTIGGRFHLKNDLQIY
jgi:hypothetical protein